ncbi:amidinotransferase [Beutenbergia cavernae DSM 12333]|uniref:Amidinotransferase n=1 Tax=Beutenbergia cavernae (strain ATCC BAA-8 / DSM 12333 / CCUG 43141 / JCM 11478 / NBRC 16432 / NCIMB 13614 / HKI 0122) TaxID=471853 RepID=C5BZH6_BEUC1|nr:dimethylargininase [Beutenbergia cavernae]ACQ79148.1 amidinotransferase [Beutenbergia cavernae DSM 12333]
MPRVRSRRYLMCPPTHYTVSYEINPWMHAGVPTDPATALAQWERLRDLYLELGHRVDVIEPLPGCPDMVYAANGATVIDGVCYTARFHYAERAAEGPAYEKWFADAGFRTVRAQLTNEGEGDLLLAGRYILAGTGFRTDRAAHAEAQEVFGLPVISLQLVDPRFYHLDTALTVLDDDLVAYHPPAFSPGSRAVLHRLFPDAIIVGDDDAAHLGLNAVSDGEHVVHAPGASTFAEQLRERGLTPIAVDTSELLKGGGGAKCCTLEIREAGVPA